MAEQKSGDPKQAEQPKQQAKREPAVLGSAAASSDPAVHQLLAERAIAVSNDDEDAIDAADAKLAELGVE